MVWLWLIKDGIAGAPMQLHFLIVTLQLCHSENVFAALLHLQLHFHCQWSTPVNQTLWVRRPEGLLSVTCVLITSDEFNFGDSGCLLTYEASNRNCCLWHFTTRSQGRGQFRSKWFLCGSDSWLSRRAHGCTDTNVSDTVMLPGLSSGSGSKSSYS